MSGALERFVESLAIPADRKTVVLAELVDHVACAVETAVREGRDPEAARATALGDLEALRASLEAVEPAFRVTRASAFARGVAAAAIVAFVVDQTGTLWWGTVAAVAALAIAAVFAPPRVLDLLRAELRSRVRGTLGAGAAIGPALTYGFTVMSAPFLIWIGLIVVRAMGGVTWVEVPWSAFTLMTTVYLVVLVEGIRARRDKARA